MKRCILSRNRFIDIKEIISPGKCAGTRFASVSKLADDAHEPVL